MLFRGLEYSTAVGRWRRWCSFLSWISPLDCSPRPAQAAKKESNKEQEDSNGNSSIGKIKDCEVEANLGDAEGDEVDDVAAMVYPIYQVTRCSANYQTKNELKPQGTSIERTQIEVSDYPNRHHYENSEDDAIRKQAESRSVVANVVKGEVITNQ
jgi:hypothetical protein